MNSPTDLRCRWQADDFFKAYSILKDDKLGSCLTPTVACLAFSLELYIKDLLLLLAVKPPTDRTGHDISILFEKIPPETSEDIYNILMRKGSIPRSRRALFIPRQLTNKEILKENIASLSKGFNEWRYSHEINRTLIYETGFAESLIEALKQAADTIRNNHQG